jgi:hypothetical protein
MHVKSLVYDSNSDKSIESQEERIVLTQKSPSNFEKFLIKSGDICLTFCLKFRMRITES